MRTYRLIRPEVPFIVGIWIFLSCVIVCGNCLSTDVFSDADNPGVLHRLVIDKNTGRVYVGATDNLYQLSPSLKLEFTVQNGPKEDNPNCPPPISECQCIFGSNCKEFEKTQMHSVSKALVIDYRGERLISCMNLYQGHCDKHLLSDISQKDSPIWTMLVPNDEESPVVMFVAPGPPNPASTDVLYVAATRSTKGLPAYKDIVPAICMRSLQDLNFVSDDILTPSRIEIEVQQRDLFRVNYIYGFGSLGFSYFLMVQRASVISDTDLYVTQISRICQNDKSLYSYTEVPLECHHDGTDYGLLRAAFLGYPGTHLAKSLGLPHIAPLTDMEHIVVAIFSNQSNTKASPASSAMCVFPMRDIRRKFTETIQKCFHGTGNTGPDHFVQPKPCSNTPLEINDDYCGQHDINHPIKGTDPVMGEAIIVWNQVNVTSVAVTQTTDFTVAFLGTDDGYLKKVTIESHNSATEYASVSVERNSSINPSIAFDPSQEHVYVMTDRKVLRIPVQSCYEYTTCQQCLEARDPYCGWCSLERRCSLKSNCSSEDLASYWLPYDTGHCPKVIGIASTQAQKQSSSTSLVVITMQSLPLQSFDVNELKCAFSGYGVTRFTKVALVASRSSENSTVKCETPTANLLPPFPTGKDHIVMNLSLVSDGHDFLTVTNFTFFDCSLHNTCTQCTKSNFPCTWCVENHLCTSNKEECHSDVLITGIHVRGHSDTPGPGHCPRIESVNNTSEILISSGTDSRVLVRAIHLQGFQSVFKCLFNFNGGVERNASLVTHNHESCIQCDPVLFKYSASSQYLNVPFSILWGTRRKPLDNPNSIQVRVFKCNKMASNCGLCRAIDAKHGCGWCTGDESCVIRSSCKEGSWLGSDHSCPNPTILQVLPISGPVDGGTSLTIKGENLGVRDDDTSAMVSGVPCQVTRYITPSLELVCLTRRSRNVTSGPVVLTISEKYSAESTVRFAYVQPEITAFRPIQGPQSGGTLLTILGQNLDAGSSASVILANRTTCTVVSREDNFLVCTIGSSPNPRETSLLQLTMDGAVVTYKTGIFTFVPDPVVTDVMPEKTIFSGGVKIVVTGERLDVIESPKIIIYQSERNITGSCDVISSEEMVCVSPSLLSQIYESLVMTPAENVSISPLALHYGFLLDGVEVLRNISGAGIGGMMLVYPDPVFEKFEGGIKKFFHSKKEYLTINGKNLNVVFIEKDFKVMVGDIVCEVSSVTISQLTCLLSEEKTIPPNAEVQVHVGNNVFRIGAMMQEGSPSNLPIIIAIAVVGVIFLLIILIVCLAYRNKSKESERIVKHMMNQMNALEARVANECKEAFAELQTEMVHVSSDISAHGGIPFRDYSSFCMRVLFPGDRGSEHPIMRPFYSDNPSTETAERGLDTFNQLIGNKTFLLIFIRVLEQHEDFTAREKCNVASLLSVALQNRMEYHTDILKTLLAELIERAINGGAAGGCYHPKLLLRRTESVTEKLLTNWFTFLLYRFLKESAGEPLFLLFRAIKQQIEKGPVDALTSEAKYSLSEDKLIRQQIVFRTVTLTVVDADRHSSHEVKVLNCDTVTQVKEKILDAIYRNAPFSCRPDKDDLDLEWLNRTGDSKGNVILHDEDGSTRLEGDVKRLNTLTHYRVPTEGARMALVARRSVSVVNLAVSSEKLPLRCGTDTFYNGSLPHSQSLSMSHTINMMPDMSSRCYHLVKSQDNEQSNGEQNKKMVSEIYLTRLLSTKMALDLFVKKLFSIIFSTTEGGSCLPLAIKHLFDFLDDQALLHGITDPEVVHTWKSNSLPLRFWVNVIKNPDFIFDIYKSNTVDSCLSVVAQTFMASCSMSEDKLSKDSPSSKLLYAKDIPVFKDLVISYYENIKKMPSFSDQDLQTMLREESQLHKNEFNPSAALFELYQYTIKYNDDLMAELNADEFARRNRLSHQLDLVHSAMETEV